MNIGERILIRLNQIGKTQADLAKALNTKKARLMAGHNWDVRLLEILLLKLASF